MGKKKKRGSLRVKTTVKDNCSEKILSTSQAVSLTESPTETAVIPQPFEYFSSDDKEQHVGSPSEAFIWGFSDREDEILRDDDLLPLGVRSTSRQRDWPAVDERGILKNLDMESFASKAVVIEGVDPFTDTRSDASQESNAATDGSITSIKRWRCIGTRGSCSPDGARGGLGWLKNTRRIRSPLPCLHFNFDTSLDQAC